MGKCIVCGCETERKFDFPHGEMFLCGHTCERTLDLKMKGALTIVSVGLEDIIYVAPFGEPSELKNTYADKIYQYLGKEENKGFLIDTLSGISDNYCNADFPDLNESILAVANEVEVAYINSLTMNELLLLKESDIVNDEAREALETRYLQ